jgi:hypothetical protein
VRQTLPRGTVGGDQFPTESGVEVRPVLRRGPTGIAGEAATVRTVGCVDTECQDKEEETLVLALQRIFRAKIG